MIQLIKIILIVFISLTVSTLGLNAKELECKHKIEQKKVNKFFIDMVSSYKEKNKEKLQNLISPTNKSNNVNLYEVLQDIFSNEWKVSVKTSNNSCQAWIGFIYILYSDDKENSSESNVGIRIKSINEELKITDFLFAG